MVRFFPHAWFRWIGGGALAVLILAAPAYAQDNAASPANSANPTVGSPLLRDFNLPGTQTTPPPREQPVTLPAPPPPPVAEPQAQAPAPAPATRAPIRAAPQPAEQARAVSAPHPAPPAVEPALVEPVSRQPAVESPVLPSVPAPAGAPPWALIGAGAVAALIGVLLLQRRRRAAVTGGHPALAREAPPERVPVAAKPAPKPAMQVDLRPWLEVDFRPEKMVATATEATVHFELLVKNVGKSAAHNVRIQARMFNASASQKQEIGLFFATPFENTSDPMHVPPHLAAKFRTSVVMPKSNVREIQIQGRSLFIPTVAINILYEWGDGQKGQTSNSYVIGTEAQTPTAKMGPFRLDLGPRIYRQVGGRSIDLARAV